MQKKVDMQPNCGFNTIHSQLGCVNSVWTSKQVHTTTVSSVASFQYNVRKPVPESFFLQQETIEVAVVTTDK